MVVKSRGYVQGLDFIEVFIRQAVLIMNSRVYEKPNNIKEL